MQFPFTVVFEAPSQIELRDVLRMRRVWAVGLVLALVVGIAAVLTTVSRASAEGRGSPAASTTDKPLAHWRQRASLSRLRPPLPGAVLTAAKLLDDGRLGLSIALYPSSQLQAWRLEPRSGGLERLVTDVQGAALGFSQDGRYLAYVGADIGPPPSARDAADSVVWLLADGASAPSTGWRAPLEPGERLLDASWSPHAERLLVVSSQSLGGKAATSRLWEISADGLQARLLLSLPSGVLVGSELWSPDAEHVAFVAHSGQLSALCLLGVDGSFRYLADLESGWSPPLGFPPLAWSADGERVLFVAPRQYPPGTPSSWFQPDLPRTLFAADVAEPTTPLALADTSVDLATWRDDGQLLGLGRGGSDARLGLRLLSSAADPQPLVDVPLAPAGAYAAAWDLARARLLVMARAAGGATDFWLASFGAEDQA